MVRSASDVNSPPDVDETEPTHSLIPRTSRGVDERSPWWIAVEENEEAPRRGRTELQVRWGVHQDEPTRFRHRVDSRRTGSLRGTEVRPVVLELVLLEHVAGRRTLHPADVPPDVVLLERVADGGPRISQADPHGVVRDGVPFDDVPGGGVPYMDPPPPAELGAVPGDLVVLHDVPRRRVRAIGPETDAVRVPDEAVLLDHGVLPTRQLHPPA